MWSRDPTPTVSPSRPAHSRRPGGTTTRPWPSSSTSKAPEKTKREKGRAPASLTRFFAPAAPHPPEDAPGEDAQAAVDPARDEGAAVELRPEAGRDRDAALPVDRVSVLAGEHPACASRLPRSGRRSGRPPAPIRGPADRVSHPTFTPVPHFAPLCATWTASYTAQGSRQARFCTV